MLLDEIRLEMVLKSFSEIWIHGDIMGVRDENRMLGTMASSRKSGGPGWNHVDGFNPETMISQ